MERMEREEVEVERRRLFTHTPGSGISHRQLGLLFSPTSHLRDLSPLTKLRGPQPDFDFDLDGGQGALLS